MNQERMVTAEVAAALEFHAYGEIVGATDGFDGPEPTQADIGLFRSREQVIAVTRNSGPTALQTSRPQNAWHIPYSGDQCTSLRDETHLRGMTAEGGKVLVAGEREWRMAQFRESALVNRPLDEVFAYLSDPRKDPEWSGASDEMLQIDPGKPIRSGTRFRQLGSFLGRRQ